MDANMTFSDIKNSDMKSSDLSDLECSEQKTKKTQAVKVCAAIVGCFICQGFTQLEFCLGQVRSMHQIINIAFRFPPPLSPTKC